MRCLCYDPDRCHFFPIINQIIIALKCQSYNTSSNRQAGKLNIIYLSNPREVLDELFLDQLTGLVEEMSQKPRNHKNHPLIHANPV
jgi:hypothetical protein